MAHSIRSAVVTIHLIVKATPHSHFALGNHGAPALRVTPEVSDDLHSAAVTVEAACENTPDGTEVLFAIEGVGEQTAAVQGGQGCAARHDPTAERRIEQNQERGMNHEEGYAFTG